MDGFMTSGGENVSDGAFERFLTSAVATILTIILSLRFLLEAERLEYSYDDDDLNNGTKPAAQPVYTDNDYVTRPNDNNGTDLHVDRDMNAAGPLADDIGKSRQFLRHHRNQRHVDIASCNVDGEASGSATTPQTGYVANQYAGKTHSPNMNKVSQLSDARYQPGEKKDASEYDSDKQDADNSNTDDVCDDDDGDDDDDEGDDDDDDDEDNIDDLIEYETDYPSEYYYYGHELEAITEEDSDDLRSVSSLGARRDHNNIENNSEYETESVVSDISSIDVSYDLPTDLSILEGLRKYGRSGSFVNTQRPLVIGPYRDNYSTFTKDRYLIGDGQLQWTIDGQNSDPSQFKVDTSRDRYKKSVSFQGEGQSDADARSHVRQTDDRKCSEATGDAAKRNVRSHTSIIPNDKSTHSKTTVLTFTMPDRKQEQQRQNDRQQCAPPSAAPVINKQTLPDVRSSRQNPISRDTGIMKDYKETDVDTLLSHTVNPRDRDNVDTQWRIQPNMGVRSVNSNRNRNNSENRHQDRIYQRDITKRELPSLKPQCIYQRRKSGATIINLSDYFDGALSSCTDKILSNGINVKYATGTDISDSLSGATRDSAMPSLRNDDEKGLSDVQRRRSIKEFDPLNATSRQYYTNENVTLNQHHETTIAQNNTPTLINKNNIDQMHGNDSAPPLNLWSLPGNYSNTSNKFDTNILDMETTFPVEKISNIAPAPSVSKSANVSRPRAPIIRHHDPSVKCTALATSTALAKKDTYTSLTPGPSDLAKSVVSSVANAEATGDNPYIAIARASARAAAMASANATSSIAEKSGPSDQATDISVVISTSCLIKGEDMDVIRENTKDVIDTLGEETKVSVRTQGLGYGGVDANSASIALPTPPQKRRVIITVDKPKSKRDNPLMIETIIPEGVTNEDLSSIISSAVKKTLTGGSKMNDNSFGNAVEIPESKSGVFINNNPNNNTYGHVEIKTRNTTENARKSNIDNNKPLVQLRDQPQEGQVDKKLIVNKNVSNNAEPVNKLNIDCTKAGSLYMSGDVNICSNRHGKQFKDNVNAEKSITDRVHSAALNTGSDRLIEQDSASQETPKHTQHTRGNEISTQSAINESAASSHRPTDKAERNAQSSKQVNARDVESSTRRTQVPHLVDRNGENNNVLKKTAHIKCPRISAENSTQEPAAEKDSGATEKPATPTAPESHKSDTDEDLLSLLSHSGTSQCDNIKSDKLTSTQKVTSQHESPYVNAVKPRGEVNINNVLIHSKNDAFECENETSKAPSRVSPESTTKPSQIKVPGKIGEDKSCKQPTRYTVIDELKTNSEKISHVTRDSTDGDEAITNAKKTKQPYTSVLLHKPEDKKTPIEVLKRFELPEKTPPVERININSARKGFIVEKEPPVTVENSWILQKLESKQNSWQDKPKPRPPSLVLVDIDIEDSGKKKKVPTATLR